MAACGIDYGLNFVRAVEEMEAHLLFIPVGANAAFHCVDVCLEQLSLVLVLQHNRGVRARAVARSSEAAVA